MEQVIYITTLGDQTEYIVKSIKISDPNVKMKVLAEGLNSVCLLVSKKDDVKLFEKVFNEDVYRREGYYQMDIGTRKKPKLVIDDDKLLSMAEKEKPYHRIAWRFL